MFLCWSFPVQRCLDITKEVFDRLQPLGICLSNMVTSSVLDNISGHFTDKLVECVKQGKKFRLVGDNVNFIIDVSHLRQSETKQKSMEHWFGSAAIIQEISFSSLSSEPQNILLYMPVEDFLPNKQDWIETKNEYIILIMRVLSKHMPAFKSLRQSVPDAVVGKESARLKQKNTVIPLPVLPKNEQTYSDVVDVLDYYESLIINTYMKAGQEVSERFTVHIGGDQLTRERFSGAKRLRAFTKNDADPLNGFPHLSPITFELFHLQMTLLSQMYKVLYSEKSTETGTLGAEKVRLGRKRADGKDVKSHYMDCAELASSLTDAYVVEAARHFFGMDSFMDEPKLHLDKALSLMSNGEKEIWVKETIGELVDSMIVQDTKLNLVDKPVEIVNPQLVQPITVLMPDGTQQVLFIPHNATSDPSTSAKEEDDYQSYGKNVLEMGLLFENLSDAIKSPDRHRLIRILKYTMVILKAQNTRSKYALEILRFLFHQLATLSAQAAHESFYGLFVNTKGGLNSHIPADMVMEHIVRQTKSQIRAVHSNKTEKTLMKRTASFAGMATISENFDEKTGVVVRAQKHTVPSAAKDVELLITNLQRIQPFQFHPGRKIQSVQKIAKVPICKIKKPQLVSWIRSHQLNYNNEIGK